MVVSLKNSRDLAHTPVAAEACAAAAGPAPCCSFCLTVEWSPSSMLMST